MADTCRNCGSELFYGQRFCRSCGNTTDPSSRAEAPTQRMTPPPDVRSARGAVNTGPTSRQETNPVYAPPNYYQPTAPPLPMQPMPPYTPPRSRSWVPILVLVIILLFGGGILAVRSIVRNFPNVPGGGSGRRSTHSQNTQSYPVNKGATFSINTNNGSITVEKWDQPQAEVTIIKDGRSESAVRNTKVDVKTDENNLSFIASDANDVEISFKVRLPGDMGAILLKTTNGEIDISNIVGSITVETVNGDVSINNASGVESVTTTNGDIDVSLGKASDGKALNLGTTNGDIDLSLGGDFKANLEASTTHGDIDIDEEFNIPVQKSRPFGQRASGPIGNGGSPLKINSTNGSINISR